MEDKPEPKPEPEPKAEPAPVEEAKPEPEPKEEEKPKVAAKPTPPKPKLKPKPPKRPKKVVKKKDESFDLAQIDDSISALLDKSEEENQRKIEEAPGDDGSPTIGDVVSQIGADAQLTLDEEDCAQAADPEMLESAGRCSRSRKASDPAQDRIESGWLGAIEPEVVEFGKSPQLPDCGRQCNQGRASMRAL